MLLAPSSSLPVAALSHRQATPTAQCDQKTRQAAPEGKPSSSDGAVKLYGPAPRREAARSTGGRGGVWRRGKPVKEIPRRPNIPGPGWLVPPPQTKTSPRELTPAEQAYIGQLQEFIEAEKESLQRLNEERAAAEALVKAKSDSIQEVKDEIGRLYGMTKKLGRV